MLRKKSWLQIAIALVVVAMLSVSAYACTTLMITAGASTTGSTSVSHANDCGTCHWAIEKIPAKDHEPGTMVEILTLSQYTNGYSRKETMFQPMGNWIPQVEHTYAYFAGHFGYMNEYQVAIGESTISGKREARNANGYFEITHLTYLAMERAATAREAIKVMGSLAEKYGFYDSGEQLTIADPNEVWLFEIVGPGPLWEVGDDSPGAYWVAQRIPDGYVGAAANNSMIKYLIYDDPEKMMMTPGIVEWAINLGIYTPVPGKEFIWRDDILNAMNSATNCGRRVWSVYNQISPSQAAGMVQADLPTYILPDKKLSMSDLFEIHRDHYEGTEYDMSNSPLAGPYNNPRRYGTIRALDNTNYAYQRTISVVNSEHTCITQSRAYLPNAIGGVLWYGANSADTTCFVPFYNSISTVTKSLNENTGTHWDFTRESLWWAIASVNVLVDARYSYMIKDINNYQAKYETSVVKMQSAIDAAALDLYKRDPQLAVDFLTKYCNENAELVRDAWWQLLDNLLWKYSSGAIYDFENNNTRSAYIWDPNYVSNIMNAFGEENIPDIRRPQVLP